MKRYMMRVMLVVLALLSVKDTYTIQNAKQPSGNIIVKFIAPSAGESSSSSIIVDVPRAHLFAKADENNLNEAISAYFGLKPEKVEIAADGIHAHVNAGAVQAVKSVCIIGEPFDAFNSMRDKFLRAVELDAGWIERNGTLQVSYPLEETSVLSSAYGKSRTRAMIELNGACLSSYLMNAMKKAISAIESPVSNQQSEGDESNSGKRVHQFRKISKNYKQFFCNLADDLDDALIDIVFNGYNFPDDASQKAHYAYLKQYPQVLQKHLAEKCKNLSARELEAKRQQFENRIKDFERDHAGDNDFIAKHKEIMQQLIAHLPAPQKNDASLHHDKGATDEKPSISAQQSFMQGYAFKMFVKIGIFTACIAAASWWAAMLYKRINDDEQREDATTRSHSGALKSKQELTAMPTA